MHLLAITTTMVRMFRCMLTYINNRLLYVKDIFWKAGGDSSGQSSLLSDNEKNFYNEYASLVRNYQNSFPIEIDLITDLEPPRELYIEIRVLEECGEIVTNSGEILKLDKNSTLLVRRCDVENLLKQNKVIQTN